MQTVNPFQADPMSLLDQFVIAEHLDPDYKKTALTYFFPLAASLADQQRSLKRPMLIAINGCQGSGKSTLAALLAQSLGTFHQLNAVAFSIDDFYLTRAERQALADRVHPLLAREASPERMTSSYSSTR